MQMKSYIKKQAKINKIDPRILIQEFVLDDLLERISLSPYRDNLVLKGGFLIASLLGVDTRSTHDIDTTIVGMPNDPEYLMNVFLEICEVAPADDPISLRPIKIEPIRKRDKYSGYRIHFEGSIYGEIKPEFKIDVSTGDKITPREIHYRHHLITEDRSIILLAYNVETILAEKLETILSRGVSNTRPKDFYDLYALEKFEYSNIDFKVLKTALKNTSSHRGTFDLMDSYEDTLDDISKNDKQLTSWRRYQTFNDYAKGISLEECCESVFDLMQKMEWKKGS